MAVKRKAVFLDKDGTLVDNVPYNVDPAAVRLSPGAEKALRRLSEADYLIVVVSNQSGVARGYFPEEALGIVEARLRELLAGVDLAGFYYCPHYPEGSVAVYAIDCQCRKPRPGLLLRAAAELQLDLGASWLIGDILDDVEAAHAAGCRAVLLDVGNETEWDLSPARRPDARAPDLGQAVELVLSASRREVART